MGDKMLKNKILTIAILILLITLNTTVLSNNISNQQKIIFVDDDGGVDYTKIQDAIENTSNNDIIIVYNGTYKENIVIDKSLKIIGENSFNTIIDGQNKSNTIDIKSDNVEITRFKIINSSKNKWYNAGIRITSSNNWIHDNIIEKNNLGLFIKQSTNNTINDNKLYGDGIILSHYQEEIFIPYNEKYFKQNIFNNTVNDKKIIYWTNQKNKNTPEDAGQIILLNCKNVIVKNTNLSNADFGCILINSSKCKIENCDISNSDGMIWLIHSTKNKIQHNQITNNLQGVVLDCESKSNIVFQNKIINNEKLGIIIEDKSNFNKVIKNIFIGNHKNSTNFQAYFKYSLGNKWFNNYWIKPRILPMIIIGDRSMENERKFTFNIDFLPSKLSIN